mmetsp:Transcript_21933/g.47831  ORF Transcript_21933/g.47831 Transcript_21933/m.47831 type:complete len:201 (+) Transcript_21933:670-1272(+)
MSCWTIATLYPPILDRYADTGLPHYISPTKMQANHPYWDYKHHRRHIHHIRPAILHTAFLDRHISWARISLNLFPLIPPIPPCSIVPVLVFAQILSPLPGTQPYQQYRATLLAQLAVYVDDQGGYCRIAPAVEFHQTSCETDRSIHPTLPSNPQMPYLAYFQCHYESFAFPAFQIDATHILRQSACVSDIPQSQDTLRST